MNRSFDIKKARKETRACNDLVHFNNAGAALMPIPVAQALHAYLDKEERMGGYETANEEKEALENFYVATAKLLNCKPSEVAFVENATRAWDMAFYSFKFSPGDKILTTIAEYGSNVVAYNQQAKRYGVEIVFIPNDEHGQIDVKALEEQIDERVKLISLTHIPTGGGLVNPAKEVGQIAKSANIPFLLDSCQGVGQIPLDVEEIQCDIHSGTGRKYLRGPRGTGLLYVREGLIEQLEPPLLDQHAAQLISPSEYRIRPDARRFENWEQYFAGKVALGVAIDYALSFGIEAIQARVYQLAESLRLKLETVDGIEVTDDGIERCGIVTFKTDRMPVADIKQRLREHRINVTTPKGSGSLVSFRHRGLEELVRASLHYYNSEEEIDYFVKVLQQIVADKM
ncbi:MAG: aminotransferase class V-fold PLP-dependent enzyme [Chloroflexota bacterium]